MPRYVLLELDESEVDALRARLVGTSGWDLSTIAAKLEPDAPLGEALWALRLIADDAAEYKGMSGREALVQRARDTLALLGYPFDGER